MPAWLLLISAVAITALAGCADAPRDGAALDVSAASSLKRPLGDSASSFRQGTVRLSFAGSDQLAAQIRAGAQPDVIAAANSAIPRALAAEGLVERPVAFARNELVLAVPRNGGRVRSLADLGAAGVTIAAGAPAVPVGGYTRSVLDRLGAAQRRRVLANIRSAEPDVAGVVGKLAQGAVDAGFVYRTDVRAAADRLRAISLPERLRPQVVYQAAVVRGSDRRQAARAYLRGLVDGPAAVALRGSGFLPAP